MTPPATRGCASRAEPREAAAWRVLVEEHELLDADPETPGREPGRVARLVYADTVTL